MKRGRKGSDQLTNFVYHAEFKDQFLATYDNETTRDDYRNTFRKISTLEQQKNKDFYDFSMDEIEQVLRHLTPKTNATAEKYGRTLSAYIEFAKNQNKIAVNILETIKKNTWFHQFTKEEKIYYTRDEILGILGRCENYNDTAIVKLLFAGVSGQECVYIRNLKKTDVHIETNQLTLTDEEGDQKSFTLTDDIDCMAEVVEAMGEATYVKRNGFMLERENLLSETELFTNDYVFRNSNTNSENANKPIGISVINRRLKTIAETLGLSNLTARNIYRSGIIYEAFKLYCEHGQLTAQMYGDLAKKYGFSHWYSVSRFCTEEVILSLYGNQIQERATAK